jgi:hypothetical protein
MLTGYGMKILLRVAPGDEDDVPLACVRIVALQKEELLDAVVSQCRGCDYCADRAC